MYSSQLDKRHFFYDLTHISSVITPTDSTRIYRGSSPIAEIATAGSQTQLTLIVTDNHSSVIQANTNNRNENLAYSPYGIRQKATTVSLTRFNGEIESGFGLYALGQGRRFYSPVLMRFISPDVIGPFEPGNPNTYSYCGGDPVNYADPTGLKPEPFKNPAVTTHAKSVQFAGKARRFTYTDKKRTPPELKKVPEPKSILKAHQQQANSPDRLTTLAKKTVIEDLQKLDPNSRAFRETLDTYETTINDIRFQSHNMEGKKPMDFRFITYLNIRRVLKVSQIRAENDATPIRQSKFGKVIDRFSHLWSDLG
jgi:RHS repeat-associated protein